MAPNFVLNSQKILNVPRVDKELSWQLGEGGWKLSRLRFLLVCGLVRGHFEQPHEDILLSMSQSSITP
jgi:hypothetical protein